MSVDLGVIEGGEFEFRVGMEKSLLSKYRKVEII
jgi:hypothetical protein